MRSHPKISLRTPGALPTTPGRVFVRLETGDGSRNDMVSTGALALCQPFDPRAVQLLLFAVTPDMRQ